MKAHRIMHSDDSFSTHSSPELQCLYNCLHLPSALIASAHMYDGNFFDGPYRCNSLSDTLHALCAMLD
jgi:hypothetical protein